jgi:hypothetical protein
MTNVRISGTKSCVQNSNRVKRSKKPCKKQLALGSAAIVLGASIPALLPGNGNSKQDVIEALFNTKPVGPFNLEDKEASIDSLVEQIKSSEFRLIDLDGTETQIPFSELSETQKLSVVMNAVKQSISYEHDYTYDGFYLDQYSDKEQGDTGQPGWLHKYYLPYCEKLINQNVNENDVTKEQWNQYQEYKKLIAEIKNDQEAYDVLSYQDIRSSANDDHFDKRRKLYGLRRFVNELLDSTHKPYPYKTEDGFANNYNETERKGFSEIRDTFFKVDTKTLDETQKKDYDTYLSKYKALIDYRNSDSFSPDNYMDAVKHLGHLQNEQAHAAVVFLDSAGLSKESNFPFINSEYVNISHQYTAKAHNKVMAYKDFKPVKVYDELETDYIFKVDGVDAPRIRFQLNAEKSNQDLGFEFDTGDGNIQQSIYPDPIARGRGDCDDYAFATDRVLKQLIEDGDISGQSYYVHNETNTHAANIFLPDSGPPLFLDSTNGYVKSYNEVVNKQLFADSIPNHYASDERLNIDQKEDAALSLVNLKSSVAEQFTAKNRLDQGNVYYVPSKDQYFVNGVNKEGSLVEGEPVTKIMINNNGDPVYKSRDGQILYAKSDVFIKDSETGLFISNSTGESMSIEQNVVPLEKDGFS